VCAVYLFPQLTCCFPSVACCTPCLRSSGDVIEPVDNPRSGLVLQSVSIAEIIRAAGLYVPVGPEESARDHEIKLERDFLNYNLRVVEAHSVGTRPSTR
jgi:hypothetical protein